MSTTVTIIGNVGSRQDLKFTNSNKAVCSFSVAVTERIKKGDEWEDGTTTWYKVTGWEQDAELITENIEVGQRVIVSGNLTTSEYTTDKGEKRQSLEVSRPTWGIIPKRFKKGEQRAEARSAEVDWTQNDQPPF